MTDTPDKPLPPSSDVGELVEQKPELKAQAIEEGLFEVADWMDDAAARGASVRPPTRGKPGAGTYLAPFAVGHESCKRPSINSLPPGWHWCRREQRVVTDAGIVVPLVDDPLVGSEEQRGALRFLECWRAKVVPFSKERGAA